MISDSPPTTASAENYALEVHGSGSRCVLQQDAWVTKESDNVTAVLSAEHKARCYEVRCCIFLQ